MLLFLYQIAGTCWKSCTCQKNIVTLQRIETINLNTNMKKKVFLLITLFVFCVSIPMTAQSRRDLWFVGDGTMATYGADSTEARGWVQMLEQYLSPKVKLTNDAKLGISAKVFMDNQGMKQLAKQRAKFGHHLPSRASLRVSSAQE